MLTPAAVRAYANLPTEVPETLLDTHLTIAHNALVSATGVETPPQGAEDVWNTALIVKCLSSVYPWLNTFALDGAAKVGRLEGTVEARFLDATETDARVEALNRDYDHWVTHIKRHISTDRLPMSMYAI